MHKEYVCFKDGVYRVINSRVSLDSIVDEFLSGSSPETIATECFPVLSLEQVYGAITFYLANRCEIDIYLQQQQIAYQEKWKEARQNDPDFYERLSKMKVSHGITK
jgi:uncharacterized protein (DUF433 family)